jgi:CheY-like chemotaxis protein
MLLNENCLPVGAEKNVDVLIVEDEPTARRALRTLVAARGYQTDAVCSGEDALQNIADGRMPRVALVDLDLPGMNGLELIRRMSAINPDIFSILITAAARDVVELFTAKAVELYAGNEEHVSLAYFQKPVDFDRLMTLLSEHQSVS